MVTFITVYRSYKCRMRKSSGRGSDRSSPQANNLGSEAQLGAAATVSSILTSSYLPWRPVRRKV